MIRVGVIWAAGLAWTPCVASDRTPFAAVVGGSVLLTDAGAPTEGPMPIRRVFIPNGQLVDRVAAAGDGPYVRTSRTEFEAKVRAAARAKTAPTPQLVSAAYSGTFADGRLTGSGTWTVSFPSPGAGPVPLDPLRVAIANTTWEGGSPAVVYRPATGPPVLWTDPTTGSVARFEWSAGAVEEPGERRYDLRLPMAPVASIEITLPASHTLAVPRTDALLTGP